MSPAPVTRRRFLHGSAVLGASVAVGACHDDPAERSGPDTTTTTTPTTAPPSTADGTLVVVTLMGGNDALNTVAPVTDDRYRQARGALALDPAAAHDVGEGFALHPALSRTKALWDADRLAIVHGVGFAGLDRSHFHCMDVWQAGDDQELSSGWLGRWLDLEGNDPLDAIAVGRRLPLLARGARRSAATLPAGPFSLPGDAALRERLGSITTPEKGRSTLEAAVARSTADLLDVVDTVEPLMADDPAQDTLDARLATVATLIEAGVPARAYAVEHRGFDTHAAQATTHAQLLGQLDAALGALLERLADQAVTVVVYSEFGRRMPANGSGGTDHGSAGTVLVAGHVRPGHHGEPPPLDGLVDGDLATTVDFRAVYGGLLEGVIGVPASDVLRHAAPPLRLV